MPTIINTRRRRGGPAALGLLLLGGGLAAAATPAKERQPLQSQIEVEIISRTAGNKTANPLKLMVGITELAPSQIQAKSAQSKYQVKLFLDTKHSPAVLVCDLEIAPSRGGEETHLKASLPFRRGSRMPLGSVIRLDGSRLDVVAIAR